MGRQRQNIQNQSVKDGRHQQPICFPVIIKGQNDSNIGSQRTHALEVAMYYALQMKVD